MSSQLILSHSTLIRLSESEELVIVQEVLRHFSHLPSDLLGIHWQRYLHCRPPWHPRTIWGLPSGRSTWPDTFRLWLRLGPMFLAPFAETPCIGRSPVYILTLAAFVLLNFGVIYATNIGMLLAFRFLTGFFGSPVLATGGASMADMWSEKKRAYAIGVWGIFAVLGPSMGPLIVRLRIRYLA